jgi:hypothetical protein
MLILVSGAQSPNSALHVRLALGELKRVVERLLSHAIDYYCGPRYAGLKWLFTAP